VLLLQINNYKVLQVSWGLGANKTRYAEPFNADRINNSSSIIIQHNSQSIRGNSAFNAAKGRM
jgi:hypothetical protein